VSAANATAVTRRADPREPRYAERLPGLPCPRALQRPPPGRDDARPGSWVGGGKFPARAKRGL